jgi:hypothetical protein
MGSARSIPETMDEATVRAFSGQHFDPDEFANLSMGKGYITSAQLVAAAKARGLGESLRKNRLERFFSDEDGKGDGAGLPAEDRGPIGGGGKGCGRPPLDGYRSLSSDFATDDDEDEGFSGRAEEKSEIKNEGDFGADFARLHLRHDERGSEVDMDDGAEEKHDDDHQNADDDGKKD